MNEAGTARQRMIVGITGASGSIYGLRILDALRPRPDWETHLVVTDAGILSTMHEFGLGRKDLAKLADEVYHPGDLGAAISSGSFVTAGMVIAPTSMKTLSAIAHSYGDNLVTRAADVVLKERRRLVLLTREAPLNLGHIRNMAAVTEMGGVIFPPVPAFYAGLSSLEEMVQHTVQRVLDLYGVHADEPPRWDGLKNSKMM